MTSQRTRDRLISRLKEQGIHNEDVLSIMRETPRHIFIDEALAHRAYEDTALPIGYNQTISQPFIVARMTEALLAAGPLNKVLEVGTGSGYQTSILAPLVGELYSIERIRPLQEKARNRLRRLGIKNVNLKHTDGGMGWAAKAPFDGILAACAPEDVPEELKQQLALGGRLIIPVGGSENQELKLVVRETEEKFTTQVLECVKFVPLLSGTVR
ncbi:MAG: protein-L-isoaspartate(D-aspartate) O-methyltransferase [Neptuniibacter sp.]